jgi:hypothetical protein
MAGVSFFAHRSLLHASRQLIAIRAANALTATLEHQDIQLG